jgi:uncharacterized protein YdeI (YjbR/CyaY-like superfamily)
MNPKVDGYVRKSRQWQEELQKLRTILVGQQLTEEVKWRHPCYTFDGRNIAILGRFKESCNLTFVQGALLKDPKGILLKPGENTQAARVIRFTSVQQVSELTPLIKSYIDQAIKLEKAGLKVKLKKITEFHIPQELQEKLDQLPDFKSAFERLTPGRRRGYLLYVSSAKQPKTREARVAKYLQHILAGKGLDDE